MTKKTRTRILAGIAALGISFSVVACSQEAKNDLDAATDKVSEAASDAGDAVKEGVEEAKDAAEDAAADATGAADDGANKVKGAAEEAKDDAKDAMNDAENKTDVTDAAGRAVAVPTPIVEMYESMGGTAGHLGELTDLKEKDGRYLAAFNEGYYIAYSKDTGAQRLNGKIAETWMSEGGLESELGLPTAYEVERKDGNGWTQNFEHGDIIWSQTDGAWGSTIEKN
ncbi:hypothetical protein M0E87_07105 [Corynebacterium sp. CCM 9185]|uniref:LGFP repeat n=1 Tax=Corynebacterium marambiense TaxID=2765364 RepID=A0ABS0VTH8_9CORY|nr:hypothetical protein [Corynebacterium marambiense]MBI9000074.1 hypothetical protein [Corynebacterium marambiense]MCK7663426.1 hypothetical protein [Corynebacterium marambiense]